MTFSRMLSLYDFVTNNNIDHINCVLAKNKKKSIAVNSDKEEDHEGHDDANSVVSSVSNTAKPVTKSKNKKGMLSNGQNHKSCS